MKSQIFYLPIIITFSAWLGLLAACTAPAHDKPIVTVSIEPQKYLLEQITGDRVDVRTLIANGANPETFDPTVNHIMNLAKSIGFLRMGNIGFEAAILDKVHGEHPDLPIYNTSLGIVPVTGTHSHGGMDHDVIDPHTWTSVKNAKIIAVNMLDAMTEIDPANSAFYRRNYERFAARLDSLDKAIAVKLAPHRGEAFMVWHPSLSYFARDYGLEQIAVGFENKETSPVRIAAVAEEAREHGVKVFFYQTGTDSRHASTLNKAIGSELIEMNAMAPDWEQQLENVTDALTR